MKKLKPWHLISIFLGLIILSVIWKNKDPIEYTEQQMAQYQSLKENYCSKQISEIIFIDIQKQESSKEKLIAVNACTQEMQQQGLMFQKSMPKDKGMLFAFDKYDYVDFWMKDTYIPLDILFIDPSMKIVDIQSMKPLDLKTVESRKRAKYALEVNAGYVEKHQIKVGMYINIIN